MAISFLMKINTREMIRKYPDKKILKSVCRSGRALYGRKRYCLWLKDANPSEIRNIPEIKERIEKVREFRSKSTKYILKNG